MADDDLLPCPFCGESVNVGELTDHNCIIKKMYFIACKCGVSTSSFLTESDAKEFWNRRVDNG